MGRNLQSAGGFWWLQALELCTSLRVQAFFQREGFHQILGSSAVKESKPHTSGCGFLLHMGASYLSSISFTVWLSSHQG